MKILITGTGSSVGLSIFNFFKKKNLDIIATYHKNFPNKILEKKVIPLKFKLNKKFELREKKIDILIHCASSVPSHKLKSKIMIDNNFYGSKKIIDLCIKKKCKKVIFISTIATLDNNQKELSINSKKNLKDPYALSKSLVENYIEEISKKKVVDYAIFKMPMILGPYSKNNFLSNIKEKLINKEKVVYISNPNLMFNSCVHVNNISEIIYESLKKKNERSTYILCTKNKLKFSEIIKFMIKKINPSTKIKIKNSKNKGSCIKFDKDLTKKYSLYSIEKTLKMFVKD